MEASRRRNRLITGLALVAMLAGVLPVIAAAPALAASDPVINEFVNDHTGTDTEAFIEVFGDASTDYSGFTLLEIEGDSSTGEIDAVLPLGTTDAAGFWTNGEDAENGTVSWLLVEGFTGSLGDDLDTDDDGVMDSMPWTRVVDDVAIYDAGAGDLTYASVVLGPNYDGISSFDPGGASRIPDGFDTDATTDWVRNDFDGFGFVGFAGSPGLGEAVNTPGAPNEAITVMTDPDGACTDPATLIHDIQGSGSASPDVGNIREVEAVVVGDFEGSTELSGIFIQEEDGDADADAMTSEGIFVFLGGFGPGVAVGDVIRLRGSVTEFFGLTEITDVTQLDICSSGAVVTPATVTLPVASVGDWEYTEGMLVNIPQTLYASGNFNQGRFGEVDLSVGGPLDNPTNVVSPGPAAVALQDLNDRSRIQMEDGSTVQNPLPFPPYIGLGDTLRTGDTIPEITGVISYGFGAYEIHPTGPVAFTRANVRPAAPSVGSDLTVAAYNVLNYFTTLDDAGPICGPMADQGCRGADNALEFGQQRTKIISAIAELDADVVGLMEIENHPGDVPIADLVAGLNTLLGAGTYDYIATGAVGSDAIRQGVIYQPAIVSPVGAYAVLDASVDPTFNDDKNRAVIAQTFAENASGERFTVAVNHLKSKGSNCDSLGDPDLGDGQGNCNLTRLSAAIAQAKWLAGDPTGSGDPDMLIIGDLNSYANEDPIVALEALFGVDLIEKYLGSGFGAGAYSFNFFSQSGYLDHALATPAMESQVTGAAFWHVNADEPRALDYNDFNQPLLYKPDAFRSSDHDPVVVGLALVSPLDLKVEARDALVAMLPTGDLKADRRIRKAIGRINKSLTPSFWDSPETLDSARGRFVFIREIQAAKAMRQVAALYPALAPGIEDALHLLVGADARLAQHALAAAVAGGGDAKDIARSMKSMDRAEAALMAGDHFRAIAHYYKAWQWANKA